MAKWFFGGQVRKKEAKFELFGLQEANLGTLTLTGRGETGDPYVSNMAYCQ